MRIVRIHFSSRSLGVQVKPSALVSGSDYPHIWRASSLTRALGKTRKSVESPTLARTFHVFASDLKSPPSSPPC